MVRKLMKDNRGMVEWIIAVLIALGVLTIPSTNSATPFNRSADATPYNATGR
jgi:hypothetical protein